MNRNSDIIRLLCSRLAIPDGVKPYETKEWSLMAQRLVNAGLEPIDLERPDDPELSEILGLNKAEQERILRLIGRAAALTMELQSYEKIGIFCMTRADGIYPKKLKRILNSKCPPLLYYAGDPKLLETPLIGFVGSRSIGDDDVRFTQSAVEKINNRGFGVVSGGAKGVDSEACNSSLANGASSVAYLSDSLIRKTRIRDYVSAVRDGRLLLISSVNPDAGFSVGNAMNRNKYIYAQSEATIVIRSDYKKGGTWSGASECLDKKYCPLMCRSLPEVKGNTELIALGAAPIDDDWDGSIVRQQTKKPVSDSGEGAFKQESTPVQLSLFDMD